MKIGTKSLGFVALAIALSTFAGCGGGSSSTSSGGGGTTGGGGGGSVTTNNQWAWISGSNTNAAGGSYGTQGTTSASNVPAARYGAVSWLDASGNFWLFGGIPVSSATPAFLNDLWKYSPSTNQWTWVSGSNTTSQAGIYGTLNTAASGNAPGSRFGAQSWRDSSGNLYLFGGLGADKNGVPPSGAVFLNDLWKFNISSNQWTWIGGSNIGAAAGVYGSLGTAAATNVPGARQAGAALADSSGNVWLIGGYGFDSTGSKSGALNDVWKYSLSTNQWTWVAGSNLINQSAVYGTLGTAAAANTPSGRRNFAAWIDSGNNVWIFGGAQGDSSAYTPLSDLWKFSTSTGQWTWVNGSNAANASPSYGTKGTAAAGNTPGARTYAMSWIDASNNLYLFGGTGASGGTSSPAYNDLWKYSISTGQWTWLNGTSGSASTGTYGTLGTAAAGNTPGARLQGLSWTDSSGNLWLFGGFGFATSTGTTDSLNDLWRYQP